jgi:hypothetical protein
MSLPNKAWGLVGQGCILSSGDILAGRPELDQGKLPGVLCLLAEEDRVFKCLPVLAPVSLGCLTSCKVNFCQPTEGGSGWLTMGEQA